MAARTRLAAIAASIAVSFMVPACSKDSDTPSQTAPTGINKVNHVVVIYLENHSFDNLYGEFAGAEGLSAASATSTQVDSSGTPYVTLPPPPDQRFNAPLTNMPFNIDTYVPASMLIPDLVHRYYQEQAQIDGGKMDKFALISNSLGLSMGYYHTAQLPLAAEAHKYVLMDHFFHSAFGGSFLNHMWFIAAQSPVFPGAPASIVAQKDANGNVTKDGQVTPDGFVVNTSYTVNNPHPSTTAAAVLVPNQTFPTIGDRLNDKGVNWAWYSGGWNNALAGHADATFQFHHQPFAYFANYADGTAMKAAHLKDETEFIAAAKAGTLPAVSFVKPIGIENEHPGYADVMTGEQHVMDLINDVRNGPNWNDCAIIITYDENGGFWDHVAPPVIDKWGPGSRVPTIIISPFAKTGYVDHTPSETVSILTFIEKRFGLQPLTSRDQNAADLTSAFAF